MCFLVASPQRYSFILVLYLHKNFFNPNCNFKKFICLNCSFNGQEDQQLEKLLEYFNTGTKYIFLKEHIYTWPRNTGYKSNTDKP